MKLAKKLIGCILLNLDERGKPMRNYVRAFKRKVMASARAVLKKIQDQIPDPRKPRGTRYSFPALLEGVIVAILHGYDDFAAITRFIGESDIGHKLFPNDVPCRNTIAAILERLDEKTKELMSLFIEEETEKLRLIHVDGKSLRASHKRGGKPLHILNVCNSNGQIIHQMAVGDKTNEIPAAEEILKMLNLNEAVITADALLTTASIAKVIIERNGHYVFLVKGNQPYLLAECERQIASKKVKIFKTIDKGHGRIEERTIFVAENSENLDRYFPSAKRAFKIVATRTFQATGEVETETHYGITSLSSAQASAEMLLDIRRAHWTIESKLHWVIDLTWNEDRCRIRNRKTASVLSLFRKIALGVFKDAGCLNIKEGIQQLQTGSS